MHCKHNKRKGDNYGLTCEDCGEVLEGYGCGGWFGSNLNGNKRCIHGVNAWYIFADKITGTKAERKGLDQALTHLREGDTLVV